jgi:hypothetical protein
MVILLVSYENFKAFHHSSVRSAIEQTKEYAAKKKGMVASTAFEEREANIPTMRTILYGGVSGFLAGYFTTPMDVLRTRMIAQRSVQPMTVMGTAQAMVAKACYPSHMGPIRKTYNTFNAFFTGSIPRSLWWFGICGIFFPTYETLKSLIGDQ